MPYLETAQSWLTQSTLLIQARPSTTRITTKYTHKPLPPPKTLSTTPVPATPTTTATLTLKTYDPVSGVCLKYATTKAAEVSRLIQILGRLARPMAGLPELALDMEAPIDAQAGSGAGTPMVEKDAPLVPAAGAGGKKKKKGGKK